MVTLAVSVCAEELPNNDSKATFVVYDVAPSYTVTIPSAVEENTATVIIDAKPILKETEKIIVSIGDSANYDEGFRLKLVDQEIYIDYIISNGSENVAVGDVILEQPAAAPNDATVNLTFVNDKAVYSGNYRDTLTFVIAVEDSATE
jgi:hypothetical protein